MSKNLLQKSALILLLLVCAVPHTQSQSLVTEINGEQVFTVVEDMPIPWLYKTECLDVRSSEKPDCYMEKLNIWLTDHLVYPGLAVQNKTEGYVVTQFVIDKTGAVRNVEILKDLGDGCGKAAKVAVESMPDWVPGRQRGVPVNVRYTIPVKFDLK